MDIDPATLCVTVQLVMDAITDKTAAVLPILFGGRAVDLSHVGKELAASPSSKSPRTPSAPARAPAVSERPEI
ncbi:DegT/DnrJ/EryC1/StrS family aminotransferase [Streptomyces broussonetiae]|uniref:DegT/DnrJ/EryC1/StrS family aminotransferase n=1 Tax=Streptomyces broussonetiae TaxID=2686304 RepID=UPI0022776B9D|nr:DegT/DnrJ/EryC1/StrS family aminotransferase [Streptomyces broussonetiae]